jgi:fructokinase
MAAPAPTLPRPCAWLYYGTLAQRSSVSRATLARTRAQLAHRAFVDLNWRPGQVSAQLARSTLACADELKLSAAELALLLGWAGLSSPFVRQPPAQGASCPAIAALLRGQRTAHLLITYGDAGYALCNRAGRCTLRGAAAVRSAVVDTVGAGDAFAAIALAGLVLRWPRALTLTRAAEFAGAICGLAGAVPAEPSFYDPWKRRWGGAPAPGERTSSWMP